MAIGAIESMDSRKIVDLEKLIRKADSIMSTLMDDVKVEPEAGTTVSPWDSSKKVSDMQENIVVGDDKITGVLKFVKGGIAPSGILAGDGYFMALKFSNVDESATSKKVGLVPSEGSGLVELDEDMNVFIKITNIQNQIFEVVITDGTRTGVQKFDLSGLELKRY
jgi:hypothetical protein